MSGRFSNPDQMLNKWHDKKHDDHYYGRDSQQWDDNNEDARPHYATAKRNWKRPSSASEMDRKMGDLKSRQIYCVTGSDIQFILQLFYLKLRVQKLTSFLNYLTTHKYNFYINCFIQSKLKIFCIKIDQFN